MRHLNGGRGGAVTAAIPVWGQCALEQEPGYWHCGKRRWSSPWCGQQHDHQADRQQGASSSHRHVVSRVASIGTYAKVSILGLAHVQHDAMCDA
jgi:hypothetical protein